MPIETVTTAALSAALDATARRQIVVAANVANAGTEGYAPLRLSFEAQWDEARSAMDGGRLLDERGLEALRELAALEPEAQEPAARVQLDVEMVDLAANAMRFQALLQGVSRHLSLLALAAADGRK